MPTVSNDSLARKSLNMSNTVDWTCTSVCVSGDDSSGNSNNSSERTSIGN